MIPNIDQLVQNDLIHRSVYTDPKIFDLEMEYIFNKCWVYVGHAAEIPEPGDYKTTFIGRNPVIVSRLADGEHHPVDQPLPAPWPDRLPARTRKQPAFSLPLSFLDLRQFRQFGRRADAARLWANPLIGKSSDWPK